MNINVAEVYSKKLKLVIQFKEYKSFIMEIKIKNIIKYLNKYFNIEYNLQIIDDFYRISYHNDKSEKLFCFINKNGEVFVGKFKKPSGNKICNVNDIFKFFNEYGLKYHKNKKELIEKEDVFKKRYKNNKKEWEYI